MAVFLKEFEGRHRQMYAKLEPHAIFQANPGKTECDPCDVGGFCSVTDTCGGGFKPCPQGTYNDEYGKDDLSDCKKCQKGTFSTTPQANSSAVCEACSPGYYADETGMLSCKACPEGQYQK